MTAAVFELDGVTYRYPGGTAALEGLELRIPPGRRVALLGPNGSGKSTLLRLFAGLDFAQVGMLRAFGAPLTEAAFADDAFNFDFRRRLGLVFQNPEVQLFNPTVFDELAFGPLQLGWPHGRIRAAVEAMLERFAIGPLRDRSPHRLSGGEKKRVALASVLILAPEVLLLDEPTASLDPESQSELIRFLFENRATAHTVITATHDLDIVADIADHVIVLDRGRVAAQGAPAQVLADRDLLQRTRLAHAHWHVHDGQLHRHGHQHAHGHAHHHGPAAGSPEADDPGTGGPG